MKTLKDFDVKNKRVLVRCDFDIPLDEKGNITDDFRIKKVIPTIEYLIENKSKVILMGHLGRPGGKAVKTLKVEPVRKKLSEILGISIKEKDSQVILLENLRFDKRERENDSGFAQELAKLGDIYINDAFANSHRDHASIVGVPKYLPSGAGFLLEKEIKVLSNILENSEHPLVAIIGGIKIESKAKVIEQFLEKADHVLIGGKIAYNLNLTSSKLHLPVDHKDGLDIGPKTIEMFSEIIRKAKMIVWAGPLGKFEDPVYEQGTKQIAEEISKNDKAFKIAGGGDTIFALTKWGLRDKFDHISTGGGAMLQFLSGEELPGLKALGYYGS